MYFTSRGPGLKIHEKSLTDKSVYESKPFDDWRHMSEADSKCNCVYITSYRIKNQYICVDLSYVSTQFSYSILQQDAQVQYIQTEDYNLL